MKIVKIKIIVKKTVLETMAAAIVSSRLIMTNIVNIMVVMLTMMMVSTDQG